MNSFYGGQAGQDFTIAYVFTSKNGNTESLKSDLQRGWQSLIPVGSIVAISYGLPGNKEVFEANKKKDIDAEKLSYNSTIWRKEYNEDGEAEGNGEIFTIASANGLRYRLIASMSGNTPSIRVEANHDLPADAVPKVEVVDPSDVDSPLLKFSFPKEQLIQLGETTLTGANGEVKVELDTEDIDNPKLKFWLPQSQKFEKTKVIWVDAGTPDVPSVKVLLSGEEGATELTPILEFTLPKTPQFLAQNFTSQEVDANVLPSIVPDVSNPNEPKIKFLLPQAQVMQKPTTQVIDPTGRPQVNINNSDINKPFLEFQLPRAVNFYYGNLVGAKETTGIQVQNDEFSTYGLGDYYVHIPSGYIYKVVGKEGTTVTFDFVACLQAPKPEIEVNPLPAFKQEEGWKPNDPTVERVVDGTGWTLQFGLPRGPEYTVDEQLAVAPLDQASVSAEATDANTLKFSFRIPRGSRAFTGSGSPQEVAESDNGDCYLDTSTGDVYRKEEGQWQKQAGNIRGPIGKALNIVADYHVTIGESIPDHESLQNTIADGAAYIEYKQGEEKVYSPEELFAITWVDESGNETGYWQYKLADGTWGRVQVTGNISGFLATAFSEDENKAYNTHYVNSLISSTDGEDKEKTAYSQSKIIDMLSWGSFQDITE